FKSAEFDIMYGKGVSKEGEILDMGVANEVVIKSGAWYNYGEEKIGQGKDSARQFLTDHPDIMNEIFEVIKKKVKK
ncbi:hypothetical protein CO100_00230, partial [Candidatus Berkelbacteria bacterium CG_4_9_14_3_um_filter_33_5]